jgi:hypothetical protein
MGATAPATAGNQAAGDQQPDCSTTTRRPDRVGIATVQQRLGIADPSRARRRQAGQRGPRQTRTSPRGCSSHRAPVRLISPTPADLPRAAGPGTGPTWLNCRPRLSVRLSASSYDWPQPGRILIEPFPKLHRLWLSPTLVRHRATRTFNTHRYQLKDANPIVTRSSRHRIPRRASVFGEHDATRGPPAEHHRGVGRAAL